MTLQNAAPMRPILTADPALAARGMQLAGGLLHFSEISVEAGGTRPEVLPVAAAAALYPDSAATLARLARPRPGLGALPLDRPLAVAAMDLRDDPVPLLEAGAAALLVTVEDADNASPGDRLLTLQMMAPVILRGATAALAATAEVAAWQAPDWPTLATAALPTGCLRLTPAPRSPLADARDVRCLFDSTAAALDAHEAAGLDRAGIAVDLGAVAAAALPALGLLHGLGCPLLADLTPAALPHATAAAAVLAAGQGVQLLTAPDTIAVAAGLSLWRAALAPQP